MQPKILLLVNTNKQFYEQAIEECGAIAISKYLPDDDINYDGLLICGGNDIDPSYYGQEINGAVDIDIERDKTEIPLVKKFIETKKPILGICRGHQLLNVALGGSLIQHLEDTPTHRQGILENIAEHPVVATNGFLKDLYGENFNINSIHHQAVDKVANGLKVVARYNNVIEALEHKTLPFYSVQFHPERMCLTMKNDRVVDGIEIFKFFIKKCIEKKNLN